MAFNRPTIQEIYARIVADIEARVTGGEKVPQFSLLGVLAAVFAGAVHLVYGFISWATRQLFPATMDSEHLDATAEAYGIPRKAATFATGRVKFTGTPATVVAAGTEIQNAEGLIYSTISEVTLGSGGYAEADVQADAFGSASNDPLAVRYSLSAPLAGVDTEALVLVPPNGGEDLETDASLRARVLQRMQNPPSSGTAADFIRWAQSVAGVGRAWCLPAEQFNGPGTVGVVIATAELGVVDPDVHAAVVAYIETVRPVCSIPQVKDIVPVSTVYTVLISPNTESYRHNITANLTRLHLEEAEPAGTILLSHIRSAISSAGVADYNLTGITVGGSSIGVQNIVTTGYNTAAFGSVTFGDL